MKQMAQTVMEKADTIVNTGAGVSVAGGSWAWFGSHSEAIGAICAVVGALVAVVGVVINSYYKHKSYSTHKTDAEKLAKLFADSIRDSEDKQ